MEIEEKVYTLFQIQIVNFSIKQKKIVVLS